MFTSWAMLPERIVLNLARKELNIFKVDDVVVGNALLGRFRVDKVDEDGVELYWKAFGMMGTHFLRREVKKGGEGEVEWWFETVIWDTRMKKEAPVVNGRWRRALMVFHDVYAKMLLGDAVGQLGF